MFEGDLVLFLLKVARWSIILAGAAILVDVIVRSERAARRAPASARKAKR